MSSDEPNQRDPKQAQLDELRVDHTGKHLTTDQGARIGHTDDSLKIGERGPTLLEDFHAREKITHFDHERIPERVVHARGAGAYGHFQAYDDWLTPYTAARFLTDPNRRTPVFTRFSTVAGNRGSADTVRDVRGFATKFFTNEGNYDLVGNNFPVFFIQDGIKFPDFVHAVKPEPHNEIPQAQSAHDTLWDFVAQQPETLHTIMWLMSDRALPRSYRMMQGFGVHTFRFVNDAGEGTFVKFHWTPQLGTHSLLWDECQKVAGKDPDFNRRDLWEAIEAGAFPEWELGVQLVSQDDEFAFDFDLLDATKIIPEEQVPVQPVGKLTLNRNPENYFAETEQVAFHTANIVPGIDFTNDPLLQARNFSYLDTQLIRLGGPNFAHLPVNRAVAPVHHNQRDGFHQNRINQSRTSYATNTLSGGCPMATGEFPDVFEHYQQKVEGDLVRRRSESFKNYYSQATLFWNSMTDVEQQHIVAAYRFELGKVGSKQVRADVVAQLGHINYDLASRVAAGIGVDPPAHRIEAHDASSPALSQVQRTSSAATRSVAILAADGVNSDAVRSIAQRFNDAHLNPEVLAIEDRSINSVNGQAIESDRAINTMSSVLYDAVIVAGGHDCVEALMRDGYAKHFVLEAYKHLKPVGALGDGAKLLGAIEITHTQTREPHIHDEHGIVIWPEETDPPADFTRHIINLLRGHRIWDGANADHVTA